MFPSIKDCIAYGLVSITVAFTNVLAGDLNGDGKIDLYEDHTQPIEERVEDALRRMTIQEKIATTQEFPREDREEARKIAEQALDGICSDFVLIPSCERLGLTDLRMSHFITGIALKEEDIELLKPTYVSAPCGLSSTWNEALIYRAAKALAEEGRVLGHELNLGPGMNLIRDPLAGRCWEYFSEDPYLTARCVVSYVKATQDQGIICGPKHFAANAQESSRFVQNAILSERALREIYFPAYKAAVQEGGALNIMGAYNLINGVKCCENKWLLTDVLRTEWGFKGFVVSDFTLGVFRAKEAAKAGLDLCVGNAYRSLPGLVQSGAVTEEDLDKLVRAKLYAMFKIGKFDPGYDESRPPKSMIRCKAHTDVSSQAARESVILLRNENEFLPLNKKKIKSIAVIGPLAERQESISRREYYLQGGGSASFKYYAEAIVSPLKGLKELLKEEKIEISFAEGCNGPHAGGEDGTDEANLPLIAKAVKIAKDAEVVLLYVGKSGYNEAEGKDQSVRDLPGAQELLIEKVLEVNKNVVVTVIAGSYAEIAPWVDKVPAIIWQFYSGEKIGEASAAVLFGDYNPAGRLSVSFPTDIEQYGDSIKMTREQKLNRKVILAKRRTNPDFCVNEEFSEGIFVGYRYLDKYNKKPLYPFGYGLSYTTFKYGAASASTADWKENGTVTVSIKIMNAGDRDGDEVVQLYVSDLESSEVRPLRELKAFKRISLLQGEEKEVSFTLKKDAFRFWSEKQKGWIVEPGKFDLHIGASSRDIRQTCTVKL